MKKTIPILFALGLGVVSCGKTYTCECVTTDKFVDGSTVETYTYKSEGGEYGKKMTKKQAEAACQHSEEATHSTYENWWTENGTSPEPDFTTTTECTLK